MPSSTPVFLSLLALAACAPTPASRLDPERASSAARIFDATPDATISGTEEFGQLGFWVSTAGDVNGDGYDDFITSIPGLSSATGHTDVHLGSASGLSDTRAMSMVGPEYFGCSATSAGDVNGDGYGDVIVGASSEHTATDSAFLYLGSATGLPTTADTSLAEETSTAYGWTVAGAGDVDGDGYDDVLVGAFKYNGSTGRVYLYSGSASGLSTTPSVVLDGEVAKDEFGHSVSGAGDVNDDGYDDVIIGAPFHASALGRATVYLGSASGLSTTPSVVVDGPEPNSYAGWSVSDAGDVNGDNYDDVVVGAPFGTTYQGWAQIFLGSPTGTLSTADTTLSGVGTNTGFGYSVSEAGDVNGDGYSDVIVGAYGFDAATGAATVFIGSADGLVEPPVASLIGEDVANYFGTRVAGTGDVNGDGYDDVAVGAYAWGDTYGRAYVYHGSDELVVDADGDGYTADDCDDGDADINPGASESCNGLDDDCDSSIDEDASDAQTWYADADSDGYTDPDTSETDCDPPDGFVAETAEDCDDTDPSIHPGASENAGDGVDQDCDGEDGAVDGGVDDTDGADDTDDVVADTDKGEGSCGCTSSAGGAGWLSIAAGLLVLRRRLVPAPQIGARMI